ncbi:uncharacterized protein [Chironomus tepperi]|uniref:uncharacterized protein n=1 Tax=Chironomus tepperi TaxID=113505 RepID=UPI00391FAA5B
MKYSLILVVLPAVSALSISEDFFLTRQLLAFFGDVMDDESSESASVVSSDTKPAALTSKLDTKNRADHYWTRLGHRSRTTAPPYNYDEFYYKVPNSDYNGFSLGKRKRRDAVNSEIVRQKREMEINRRVDTNGALTGDHQNSTSELPKPMLDYKFKKTFNKCCSDTEDATSNVNTNLQSVKSQCVREVKKNKRSFDSNNTTTDSEGGLYNLFSCDRLNRWKATITCTLNCMGQKLEMVWTVDSDGVIDTNRTKSVILEYFVHESWQQEMSDDAVDKCGQEVSSMSGGVLDKYGLQCNTRMAEFAYCLWREFFVMCPSERQNRSKQCEKLRYILRKNHERTFNDK